MPGSAKGTEAGPGDAGEPLWAGEEALVVRAVPSRRRDVRLGRSCARRALAAIGAPVVALPAGRKGAPRWPESVVGSITHTDGYAAAAVAWRSDLCGLGIDAETIARVEPSIVHLIAREREAAWLAGLPEAARAVGRALVFSAKEAAYKCQFPLTGAVLGFRDASLRLDTGVPRDHGAFEVRFRRTGCAASLTVPGRYLIAGPLVVTAAYLLAGGAHHQEPSFA